jgi:hypothetical protein
LEGGKLINPAIARIAESKFVVDPPSVCDRIGAAEHERHVGRVPLDELATHLSRRRSM